MREIKNWGNLFIVATPIGNMEDVTFRAVRILSFVDIIFSEDSRVIGKLLSYYGIVNYIEILHEYNEKFKINAFMDKIKFGTNIALVTNSGTPLLSDPGFSLVRKSIEIGVNVVPIPGSSAITASLSVAGITTSSFIFNGFITRKKKFKYIRTLKYEGRTISLYESPKRLFLLLYDILRICGNRFVVIAQEMTKIHENFIRGYISEVLKKFYKKDVLRGECCVLISGAILSKIVHKKLSFFYKNKMSIIPKNVLSIHNLSVEMWKRETKMSLKKTYNIAVFSNRLVLF